MVEFVSYDGKWPNLCSGVLVLRIDGKVVEFPKYCMTSGGCIGFSKDWEEFIEYGAWSVDVPEEYKHLRKEIEECVNENVTWGCCGGCI